MYHRIVVALDGSGGSQAALRRAVLLAREAEAPLHRPARGIPTLVLAWVWLVLAGRGTGRPYHVAGLDEPLLAARLGQPRLPSATTLHRRLRRCSAHGVRAAVEAAYRAELPRRAGRVWVSRDSHQLPYWGRARRDHVEKGGAGNHGRRLRGSRLFLAVATTTGQILAYLLTRGGTPDAALAALRVRRVRQVLGRRRAGVVADSGFTRRASVQARRATDGPVILGCARSAPVRARLAALSGQPRRWLRDGGAMRRGACPGDARRRLIAVGARSPTDSRGPWVYVTSLRSSGPQRLIALYRRRGRVEQTIDDRLNGHAFDHRVGTRLAPNRVAVGFRLLARTVAIGLQLADAAEQPAADRAAPVIHEPRACRAAPVDGLGTFTVAHRPIVLHPLTPSRTRHLRLGWTRRVVRLAA